MLGVGLVVRGRDGGMGSEGGMAREGRTLLEFKEEVHCEVG